MMLLISEISASLFVAFLLGCLFMWLWRGIQLKSRVAEAKRTADQHNQFELATLRSELQSSQEQLENHRQEIEQQALELDALEKPVMVASSTAETEQLKSRLAGLKERYDALHGRWERERTQFAQLVSHKNARIAELERQSAPGEHAVIEDGAAVDNEEDNSSYSRQQLETMLVDLRARVADQESELSSLRASGSDTPAPVMAMGITNSTDTSMKSMLDQKDRELSELRDAMRNQGSTGSRLVQIEQERAELLHRVSELNSQRASDADHTANMHREIESVRTDLRESETTLQARNSELESLQSEHNALSQSLLELQAQADKLPALESRCSQLSEDVTTLQSMLDAANASHGNAAIHTLTGDNENVSISPDSEVARLRSERRTLQSELHALQENLNSLKRESENREQQIRRAHSELDELRPLQHQLVQLRGKLSDLIDHGDTADYDNAAHAEIAQLRTRVAQLQADGKLNLERKESYYQGLLREKSALIAELQNKTAPADAEA